MPLTLCTMRCGAAGGAFVPLCCGSSGFALKESALSSSKVLQMRFAVMYRHVHICTCMYGWPVACGPSLLAQTPSETAPLL